MKSSTIVTVIVILLILGGIVYAVKHSNNETISTDNATTTVDTGLTESVTVTYLCDENKSITATFTPADENVELTLSDDRTMTLPHVISGSGARYANEDESFVFWNKGNTAFITENGEETFSNCATGNTAATTTATQ
jgi:membrane-bound inhibitor of C-type lysozyme